MNSVNLFKKNVLEPMHPHVHHMEKNSISKETKENFLFNFIIVAYSTIDRHSDVAIQKCSEVKCVE